ncbi:AAA family ATPase [Streptomyces sp. NPDC058425]|uniref:helix-turn-helix transcriptional regulator n=2 Tax=unclassified Streptomyces TaxID=2593676 RepID=UPI003646E95C
MNAIRGFRFIGRADALDVLRHAARTAAAGVPRVVVVSGPAGMGKTTLVGQFSREVEGEFTVVRAGDVPPKPDLPFHTVTGLLDTATHPRPTPRDGDRPGAALPGGDRPGASVPGGDRPPPSVLGMGAAVIGLLDSLLARGPVLFWVDDAHRVDRESLQAVGFALLRQGAERVLTVLCAQDPARTLRETGLRELVPEPDRVDLGGFTLDETRDFVESRTARPHAEGRLRDLAVWSHGNPLFLEAALGAFGGRLPQDPAATGVPSTLSEAVGAWSRSFPPAGRAILTALAVLDAPATLPLLGQLLNSDTVGADAEALVEQRAAVWVPSAVPALALVHAGQRDALYAALPRAERDRMHLRVAAFLEPPAGWRHRVAAAEAYDPVLAGQLRAEAARETDEGHAAPAAEYLLAASQVDPEADRRQEALVAAVRLQVTGGQARTALRHEEAVARSPEGPLREEGLGLLGLARGTDSRARSRLERARDGFAARGDLALAARAAAELAVAENSLGHGPQSLAAAGYALRHTRDDTVRGMAQAGLAYGHALVGGPAAGLGYLDRLPGPPERVPATHTDALMYRGVFRGLAGDVAGAVCDLSAAARRRDVGMSRVSSVAALTHSIWCLFALGEWQEARGNLSVALDIAHTTGRAADFFSLHCFIAVLRAFGGRPDEAGAALAEARSYGDASDFAGPGFHLAAARAMVAFAAGDHEAVAALAGPAVRDSVNASRSRLYALRNLPPLGVAYARTGDTARAREVLRDLGAAEPRGALLPVAVRWVEGAVAVAEGDPETAARAYRAGLAVPPDGGEPLLHRTFLREDLGTLLLGPGAAGPGGADAAEGRRHLADAEAVYARLGAEPLRLRCRALLTGPDPPPPAGTEGGGRGTGDAARTGGGADAVAGDGALLTDRERDIAELVARGWTNREIAARLYLSVKTVEYHLGKVYAKNGIRGRRELRDLIQAARRA